MKCPICKSEMEKGSFGSDGRLWLPATNWGVKLLTKLSVAKRNLVYAYRCPTCKKIELTSEK